MGGWTASIWIFSCIGAVAAIGHLLIATYNPNRDREGIGRLPESTSKRERCSSFMKAAIESLIHRGFQENGRCRSGSHWYCSFFPYSCCPYLLRSYLTMMAYADVINKVLQAKK
jgi:hypothetical protein